MNSCDKYGRWVVLKRLGKRALCRCSCGTEKLVLCSNLRAGVSKSCGCYKSEKLKAKWQHVSHQTAIAEGTVFGRLRVLSTQRQMCQCLCSCGKRKEIRKYDLLAGKVKSCGCLRQEVSAQSLAKVSTKHGQWDTKEWNSWYQMLSRCTHSGNGAYPCYGGAGITLCSKWQGEKGFENFFQDVGEAPTPKHSLDRIDNSKGYEPDNVRWATAKQQARNRRGNRNLTAFGKTQCLSAWAEETGIQATTIVARIAVGWDIKKVLSTPVFVAVKAKHPIQLTKERRSWQQMIRRCRDIKFAAYSRYGGRGIRVCPEWSEQGGFDRFLGHIGKAPSPTHSLDRIHNDGNYEPGNVRWATPKEQARNTRKNRQIQAWGRTQTLAEWAEEVSISGSWIVLQLKRGATPEEALTRKGTKR